MKKTVFSLSLLIALLISSASYADITLTFGLYAFEKPSSLKKTFDPILTLLESELEKRLGEPVTIKSKFTKTYEEGIKNLVEGEADFARFGPSSYIMAKHLNPEIEILAMETKNGKKTFNGVICVAKDSYITKITDLKGKSFAFGDERSTIGRYLSQLYLANNGIKASDFNKYEYLNSHNKVAIAVARRHFDAGAFKESTYQKMVKKGAKLRILASFPNVTKPWIARSGLSGEIITALRESFLELKETSILKDLKMDGFATGKDSDYETIRASMSKNADFFK